MDAEFVTLTPENLAQETLCCIVRTRTKHPGVEAKRAWLAERLPEGHVFCKLRGNGCAFVEYAPLEAAWVPVLGENYLYLYCLWVQGAPKGQGYGRALMERCIADARAKGRAGVCMLGAKKQKAWLSDQSFARKFGFETVDTAANMSCWRCVLTVRSRRGLRPVSNGRRSARTGWWSISATSARSSRSARRSCKATARHTASRRTSAMWILWKWQSHCPVCSTTGPCSGTGASPPSIRSTARDWKRSLGEHD